MNYKRIIKIIGLSLLACMILFFIIAFIFMLMFAGMGIEPG